ncbi:MAG: Rossmann fold nucleotide-binding protein Smf [Labilithrix sp.]|nr:Rossmann fold nucleotide-binding protein Smf [Labilithrix sp.]
MQIKLDDPDYPAALRQLPNPPSVLTTSGPLERRRAIAIVGSRDACDEALIFAHGLAFQLASAGILVISGGAVGVDGAAHRGALAANGATWVVSPTGKDRLYPLEHRALFAEVAASTESRMVWAFADHTDATPPTMRYRNGVLAAFSEALIVVQAHYKSGSRNAAGWARGLRRPVWAVTAAPWMGEFCGSLVEVAQGTARPLCSAAQLFRALALGDPATPPRVDVRTLVAARPRQNSRRALAKATLEDAPPQAPDMGSWTAEETSVFTNLCHNPMHIDEIADRTGFTIPPIRTALLTLSLKDVVVEGPDGFYRRRFAS